MSQLPNTIELYEKSREYSKDAENATMTREFLVPADRESATTYPGIPTIGSTFLIDGINIKLDRHDVRSTGDPGISKVICLYSANGTFRFPTQQDEQSPTFKATNFAIQRRKISIPAFMRAAVLYEDDNLLLEKFRWVRADFENVEISEIVLQARVSLQSFSQSDWVAILLQVNAIHTFGGRQWKFSGANINQSASAVWEVTYEWIHDPGNKALPAIADGMIVPPARAPFEEYFVTPAISESGSPQCNVGQIGNNEVPNGHLTLPGNPI